MRWVLLALLTAGCASAPRLPTTIAEVCPLDDDTECAPATDAEVRAFLKEYP